MDYVGNLRIFVRIYELNSISAAGRDLRISAAVASNRLADLEEHVGARLFNRSTRSIKPTEHGVVFYEGAKRILQCVSEAESDVAKLTGKPRGTIFVGAQFSIGRTLLAPMLAEFAEQYPDIKIRLRLSDRKLSILEEGLDICFVADKLFDSDLRVRKIAECPRGLFASPAFVEAHGMPQSIDDILAANMPCLQLRFPGAHEFRWSMVTENGVRPYTVNGPLECDDGDVLTEWALEGRGIVNKAHFEIRQHLQAGRLIEVAAATPPEPVTMAALLPDKRLQDAKVNLLAEFVMGRCRKLLSA